MTVITVGAVVDIKVQVVTTKANEDAIATYMKWYRQGMLNEAELFIRLAELFANQEESK